MTGYNDFKEAGIKRPDWGKTETANKPEKMKIEHERIRISSESFPYLKGLKVGDECEIKIKVKKTGQEMREDDKNKKEEITLEILKISEPLTDSAPYKNMIKEGAKSIKE